MIGKGKAHMYAQASYWQTANSHAFQRKLYIGFNPYIPVFINFMFIANTEIDAGSKITGNSIVRTFHVLFRSIHGHQVFVIFFYH